MSKSRLEIEGVRVVLREFSDEHLYAEAYFSWLRDLRVVETINRVEYEMPIRFESVEAYVRNIWTSSSDAFFAVIRKADDRFVGTVRLLEIDWRAGIATIGVMIGDRSCWGQGLATDTISTAGQYAFRQLGLRRLVAGTPETNLAMLRCFKRLGFQEEGRLRKHVMMQGVAVDRVLFGVLQDEFVPCLAERPK
jgi:RimJ/RimL family protein N-acetyltransferase